MTQDFIYLDFAATTPVDERVVSAMMPYMTDVFYNAASSHAAGLRAQQAVLDARGRIARHIGARMQEIIFTSGATEAINLAILGCLRHAVHHDERRRRIVTVATEHAAVRDASEHAREEGADVVFLGVDSEGRLNLDDVRRAVQDNTLLLSVMAVNNETGVVQDLAELSRIAHDAGALFMTDATQAYGKMPIDVEALGIDLMSFSGHKIYGPKGIGALYVRQRPERTCKLEPLFFGGGQERGMRSGTINVAGVVGLAVAGDIGIGEMESENERLRSLRAAFELGVTERFGGIVNGQDAPRNASTSNITFPVADADLLLMNMADVCCSKGSACSSAKPKPSPVLTAMGRSATEAGASLRFSFGRSSSKNDVDAVLSRLESAFAALDGVEHR